MIPDDTVAFTFRLCDELPPDWGFLSIEQEGVTHLIVAVASDFGGAEGWLLWLSKKLPGGQILRGGVHFTEADTEAAVEGRVWLVLGELRSLERGLAARYN